MRAALAMILLSACTLKGGLKAPVSIGTGGGGGGGSTSGGGGGGDSTSAFDDRTPPLSDAQREAQAPEIPDPKPPAYRDSDGVLHGPGGPISDEPADCGPAKNHCLRGNGWFTISMVDSDDGRIAHLMQPVFMFEGHWYNYKGKPADNGTVKRTRPATAETIKTAGEVYVFVPRGDGKVPASEKDALTSRQWDAVSPYTIDVKAGTFFAVGQTYSIAAARIPFDARATP